MAPLVLYDVCAKCISPCKQLRRSRRRLWELRLLVLFTHLPLGAPHQLSENEMSWGIPSASVFHWHAAGLAWSQRDHPEHILDRVSQGRALQMEVKWKWKVLSHVRLFSAPSSPGSSVHGILQARILEWVAVASSRGSSPPNSWLRNTMGLPSVARESWQGRPVVEGLAPHTWSSHSMWFYTLASGLCKDRDLSVKSDWCVTLGSAL